MNEASDGTEGNGHRMEQGVIDDVAVSILLPQGFLAVDLSTER